MKRRMKPSAIDDEILCRPARPSDREAVMEFLPLLGRDDDYVTDAWEEWLADGAGRLAAAVLGGRVVGLSHLADLGGGEWWLEGLRVDPRLHGRRIGSHLHDYQVGEWLATDGEVVRLVTRRDRRAVHRMCARTGFEKTATITDFAFDGANGEHRFRPVGPEEADSASARFLSSSGQAALGGLMDLGWKFARLNAGRVGSAAREGRLWAWQNGDGLLAARFEDGEGGPVFVPSAVVLPEADRLAFLQDVRRLAGSQGARGGLWLVPDPWVEPEALAQAGYSLRSSDALWIFERRR